MKKISIILLASLFLGSCSTNTVEQSSSITEYSSSIIEQSTSTTEPSSSVLEQSTSLTEQILSVTEQSLQETEVSTQILKNTDGISAYIENKIPWIDENYQESLGTVPSVYMALYDTDFDNNPEFFLGILVRTGINWTHYDTEGKPVWHFTGASNRPFLDGRLYIDSESEEYYRTVTYIGNPTFPGAIISVIKNENGKWYITTSETYNEAEFETTDSYTEIHAFEVEIDRSDIKGSVEKCFEGYYENSVQE